MLPEDFVSVQRLRFIVRLHLLGLAATAVLVLIAARLVPNLSLGGLLLTLVVLAILEGGIALYLQSKHEEHLLPSRRNGLMIGQLAMDILGLTVVLHLSGGIENPFFPFYVFPVILAAALLTRRVAIGCAAAGSLLYAGLLIAEGVGWLPHLHLREIQDPVQHLPGSLISRASPGPGGGLLYFSRSDGSTDGPAAHARQPAS